MNTIYIVPIEPIDARYTKQWYDNIPDILTTQAFGSYMVETIAGEKVKDRTTEGAFLDFGATNAYKASQIKEISKLFSKGKIKDGDKFLVTDAWNFAITAIKYMSDLLKIKVEIHGIWHAGAYDPTDILGAEMSKPWCHHQERAWFHACDFNYFATDFHKHMFIANLGIPMEYHHKAITSGQPHDPIIEDLSKYYKNAKRDRKVIWPHRKNFDKQPVIINTMVRPLEKLNIDVMITQDWNLDKKKYYEVLGSAKLIFSCSLHENLGISMMEGCLAGALPLVPDRASYSEMYLDEFKYPSEWTSSYSNFMKHQVEVIEKVEDFIENYEMYKKNFLWDQVEILQNNYLTADVMVGNLISIDKIQPEI
jgi:hypothetical protein